jgi:hypothetical protein
MAPSGGREVSLYGVLGVFGAAPLMPTVSKNTGTGGQLDVGSRSRE